MVSKIKRCMELLLLLPEPLHPGSEQVRKIAKDVKCSEGRCWEALKRLRKLQNFKSTDDLLGEYKACLGILYRFLTDKMPDDVVISSEEYKKLHRVEELLGVDKNTSK